MLPKIYDTCTYLSSYTIQDANINDSGSQLLGVYSKMAEKLVSTYAFKETVLIKEIVAATIIVPAKVESCSLFRFWNN